MPKSAIDAVLDARTLATPASATTTTVAAIVPAPTKRGRAAGAASRCVCARFCTDADANRDRASRNPRASNQGQLPLMTVVPAAGEPTSPKLYGMVSQYTVVGQPARTSAWRCGPVE